MSIVPHRMFDLLGEGKLIPFIGSGISISSGAPSWYALVKGMLGNFAPAGKEHLLEELSGLVNNSDLAELLDSISPTEFAIKEYLIEQINSPKFRPSTYHEHIVDLSCGTIVTTNWDTLLESALWEHQQAVHVIYRDADVSQYDPDKAVQILKIHGTMHDPDSLIYKRSQYEQFWRSRPLLFDLLSTLMATKSFLFMGYGFGDPNIHEIVQMLKSRIGKTRREHYAIVHSHGRLTQMLQDLGVRVLDATMLDPVGHNATTGVSEFLRELGGSSRAISMSNFERARLINDELRRLIKRLPPKACLRMRGALGWLSNPVPIVDDPVYGSNEQDVEEHRMTELVCAFVEAGAFTKVRCILHVEVAPLLRRGYRPTHILRRLQTLKEILGRYPKAIEVALDETPSHLNQMLFDDRCSFLGFKRSDRPGIDRSVVARNRSIVQAQATAFDEDFADIRALNRSQAEHQGIDTQDFDWAHVFVLRTINTQIHEIEAQMDGVGALNLQATASSVEDADKQFPPGALLMVRAIEFAARKHSEQGQTREDGVTPYAIHVFRVVERLRAIGQVVDYEILAAAALHDVVEDCHVSVPDLEILFGPRVARLVGDLTSAPDQSSSEYLAQISSASRDARAIKLADRWDNVADLRAFQKPQFGRYSSLEYLHWSELIADACADANPRLVTALKAELDAAIQEFGGQTDPLN